MKTLITYRHASNVFDKNEFKPFIRKYFKDVEFVGFECGNWGPSFMVSNWDEAKDKLPKSYLPLEVKKWQNDI